MSIYNKKKSNNLVSNYQILLKLVKKYVLKIFKFKIILIERSEI